MILSRNTPIMTQTRPDRYTGHIRRIGLRLVHEDLSAEGTAEPLCR